MLYFVHQVFPLVVALGCECVEELLLINKICEFFRVAASFNEAVSWDSVKLSPFLKKHQKSRQPHQAHYSGVKCLGQDIGVIIETNNEGDLRC